MGSVVALFVMFLFAAEQFQNAFALPVTGPAFLWYSHYLRSSDDGVKQVSYRVLSPKDLAKSVISEGGWSKFMCSGENRQQALDIALVYVGKKLQSSDISRAKDVNQELVNFLKDYYMSSNFSMAFPYVTISEETESMENSFISGFTESCADQLGVHDIAVMESCSIEGAGLKKLANFNAIREYVGSIVERKEKGQSAMLMVCDGNSPYSENFEQTEKQDEVFSQIIDLLKDSGAKHAVLYASDPYGSLRFISSPLKRFLAEGSAGNASLHSTSCDGVCQIKSSLLEGLFVGIVLLIILLSGLCCMMGIDTPTRFEAPQES